MIPERGLSCHLSDGAEAQRLIVEAAHDVLGESRRDLDDGRALRRMFLQSDVVFVVAHPPSQIMRWTSTNLATRLAEAPPERLTPSS